MDEIALEIDEKIDDKINIDNDKPHNDNPAVTKIGKPHSGKPITNIEVSPNEIYLVTYSHEDRSIVGWNIKDIDEGPLKLGKPVKLKDISGEENFDLHSMCVSNNKEFVCISKNKILKIYDMNNDQKIKLNWSNCKSYDYCTFDLYGDLILYNDEHKKFSIYSTQTKNNKWSCINTFQISTYFEDLRFISLAYDDECYLFSNTSIYKWVLNTNGSTKILVIDENIGEDIRENIRIIDNEKFICTRIKDKIIIYSVELKIPVASLNLNNGILFFKDIQLSMFDKYPTLCSLLFPLFISNGFSDSIMKNYWKKYLCHLKQNDSLPKESYPSIIRATSKHVFGFIDGNVWKIDLEKMMFNEEYDNDVKINEEMSKMYDRLHILLLDSYVVTVHELFQEAITNYNNKYELNTSQNSIEWSITCKDYKIELQVFKNNVSICTRDVKFVELTVGLSLLGFKLINDDIIILTSIGPLIFHFNENDKSISLSYYYYIILDSNSKDNTKLLQIFSKPTFPLPNHESFKYNAKWVLDVKNNKESLLKYGVELLKFAIKEHKLELIEEIYNKCINHFEEDFNNIMFLSIINSNLPLLDKYYPEYILRYSLETAIIVDSPSYDRVNSLHLSSCQFPQLDFQFKKIFKKLIYLWNSYRSNNIVIQILTLIQFLIIISMFFTLIILLLILAILYRIMRFINFDFNTVATKKTTSFIFASPYINFVNYPKDYKWYSELFWPQPSLFIETINSDIYKTWSGEALLNFKWKKYGAIYHALIWSGYLILLVCFNVAARISQQEYVDIQKKLLKISTIFGFIYLSFEVRQLIYDPIKWILDIGKIYDERIVNDDPNNPWNLSPNYQVFENNTSINPSLFILQKPDENTNMFTTFATSFFATCLLLTGDTSSFSNWTYEENPTLMILMILFAFFMAIYILNVFITLFSEATEDHEDSFLITRAEYLAKIELFYLLPFQRRSNRLFPEVIYYCANIDEARKKVKEMIDKGEWNINKISESKKKLMEKLNIPLEKNILAEIQEMKNFSQNLLAEMQEIKKRLP
ncbi:hypothetical protein RhiirB3_474883 [Rhizophagus irregularis]|nr:hypothetical protein RhiirB3_474883 [Rhizophagus irregularis]